MCGIAGLYNPDRLEMDWDKVFDLWDAISDRGRQASGIAWVSGPEDNLKIKIMKSPRTPLAMKKFMGDMAKKDKTPLIIMMHTRYATQGSTTDNRNNHPVTSGDIVLTHNGVIFNDDEVFERLEVTREYDVDTEAIAVALDNRHIDWVAEYIDGSMSLAWVNRTNLKQLNLWTNGQNPLVFGRLTRHPSILIYASCSWHLAESLFQIREIYHARPYTHYYTRGEKLLSKHTRTTMTITEGIPDAQQPIRFGRNRRIF